MADTKQAEKEYLARAGSTDWERVKPFSHVGADTLADSASLLHDFAVAMLALAPAPDDLILDLGAGGCWCSDLLRRLNRRSVAIDISLDMLRTGRSRPGGADLWAVAGDLEHMPFRSAAFAKAVCLSAIHHVPDIAGALRELARVLRDDGVAVFSEPGKGHAHAPVASAAMRDYGVLEQDILIPEFVRACHDAGFVDVRLKPLSYAIPSFDLTPEQWVRWSALADSKRPARALTKLWRAVLELAGAAKETALFEEAFGMTLVRTLRSAMEDHPIVVAAKRRLGDAAGTSPWAARIDVLEAAPRVEAAGRYAARVRVTNAGARPWEPASTSGTGHVRLGVQLLDEGRRLVSRDHHRVALPRRLLPGEAIDLVIDCVAPAERGTRHVKFDLVAEGVTWFEPTGSSPAIVPLQVD
jgi:ubiquinone/menaquinone biosynthesis C-methylase UbiE